MITVRWRPDPARLGCMVAVTNDGIEVGRVSSDGNGTYRAVSSRDSKTFHARSAAAAAEKLIAHLKKRAARQGPRASSSVYLPQRSEKEMTCE